MARPHNRTMAANHRRRANLTNATGNPNSPDVPLDPDYWDELGWLGARSDAGVRMNHASAIGHPPIWRALNLITRGVAKLPAHVYINQGDNATIDRNHPAEFLISKKPNANTRAYVWKTTMLYHALLRGNGYSAIARQGADPIALILLDPIKTEPYFAGDQLRYKTEAGGQRRTLAAADVFHLRGLSFDGIQGHDVLSVMANALGMGPAGRKWMSKLLSRGSTAGGLLQLPRELSADARRKRQEEFDKYQSGLDNAFKTLALEDGAKWIRTMITPQEAMLFDVLNFDAKIVGNVLGIPPHKLGDDGKTSFSSLEQENKSFLEDSLDPWIIEFETEAADKLLTDQQHRDDTHTVMVDRTSLEIGDMASQAASFGSLTNNGLMLPDEARGRMNLPPLPDGQGQLLRVPVNISVGGAIPSANPPSPDPVSNPVESTAISNLKPKMQNALRHLIVDRLTRLDAIAKSASAKQRADEDFWRNHRQRIADSLAPILPILAIDQGLSVWPQSAEQIAAGCHFNATVDEQVNSILTPLEPIGILS